MIVVADASPLVFLGKIRQLDLLEELFGSPILVPALVWEEVLGPSAPLDEQRALERFLHHARIEETGPEEASVPGLSRADRAALALAKKRDADLLLADDRLLRRIAEIEGVRPLGTLGVLLQASRKRLIPRVAAEGLVLELIREHGFRISIEVFAAVQQELDERP